MTKRAQYDMRLLDPPDDAPWCRSTTLRAPSRPLLVLSRSEADVTGPVFGGRTVGPHDHDLTHRREGDLRFDVHLRGPTATVCFAV